MAPALPNITHILGTLKQEYLAKEVIRHCLLKGNFHFLVIQSRRLCARSVNLLVKPYQMLISAQQQGF